MLHVVRSLSKKEFHYSPFIVPLIRICSYCKLTLYDFVSHIVLPSNKSLRRYVIELWSTNYTEVLEIMS